MRIRAVPQILLCVYCLTVLAARANAQGTARSQDIDTSIRAAGMGGAGAGVGWGEPGVWGNPATLADYHGVGWVEGSTRLVPGLADDVRFTSQRYLLGGAGVGVSLMGEPIGGLGRTRLDYGASEGTDPFGNPTGTFNAFEEIDAWGLGVSPLQLVAGLLAARRGGETPAALPVDIALGIQRKHTRVVLAPDAAAAADCTDWGALGRVSPLSWFAPDAPVGLDVSGGFAMLNANDASFVFSTEDAPSPPSRIRRMGIALHGSLHSCWCGRRASESNWFLAGIPNALELGIARDDEHVTAGGTGPGYDVQRFGLELTLLGMFTNRIGHVRDRVGGIVGNTYGFGARLPIGPWASVAYDYATIPQASDQPMVTRQGWSLWLDPVRILRDRLATR